jgi:hypothetical protein
LSKLISLIGYSLMDHYTVFGANISSELKLPLVSSHEGATADIFIRNSPDPIPVVGVGHDLAAPDGTVVAKIEKRGSDLVLDFIGVARFRLNQKTLWVDREADFLGTADETASAILLNQVLPMALSVHSDLLLHASSLTDGISAWAFIGPEGTGKSTLAAGLFARGYTLLSDDATRVQIEKGAAQVIAGVPEIRLFAATFEKIFPNRSLDETSPVLRKRRLRTSAKLASEGRANLKTIFCLNPDSAAKSVSVRPIQANFAFELALPSLFRFDIWDCDLKRREFENLTRLLQLTPAFEVIYPFDWNELPHLLDLIEAEIKNS